MKPRYGLMLLVLVAMLGWAGYRLLAQEATGPGMMLHGTVVDIQGQPVQGAEIAVFTVDGTLTDEAESREDGTWQVMLYDAPGLPAFLTIERAHFASLEQPLSPEAISTLHTSGSHTLPPLTLVRHISPGFWVATLVFLGVVLLIILEKGHATTIALLGVSVLFLVHYLIGGLVPGWRVFGFEEALRYINWEVIFLLIGMMIIISVIEGTGVFQWLAFQSYRLSRGRSWLLVLILMLVTAAASALLDNFTTMLLMVPISLQIALATGLNPMALIIPEVMASNVGGISTLIGTPTNILIGAYAEIGFSGFLRNQTLGVIAALLVMTTIVLFHYRQEWRKTPGSISPTLYDRLAENGRIRQPDVLLKSGLVFLGTLALFIIGEQFHMEPAVAALAGAAGILLWVKPGVNDKIKEVDWTTLVFLMSLFIIVGAIQEVGLLDRIAVGLASLIGDNLVLGIILVVFGVGTLSLVIANIPLAASMLPVVSYLSASIPGAGDALYYALSMGTAMGGNGLIIGGEANLVTAGIAERAGTSISPRAFARIGLPITFATLTLGTIWLLLRFV